MARVALIVLLSALAAGCATTAPTTQQAANPIGTQNPVDIKPKLDPRPAPVAQAPLKPTPAPQVARSNTIQAVGPWAPKVSANTWRYIVIHHSATPSGSAAVFDAEHRQKWDELGYHFVIGNGTQSGDGQVEVGPRWWKQKWGAHAKTADNRYNNFGVGICLVGNFETKRPSPAQLAALNRLVAWLMYTYDIPASNVIGHRDTKSTACPGRYTDVVAIRSNALQLISRQYGTAAAQRAQRVAKVGDGELLRDDSASVADVR